MTKEQMTADTVTFGVELETGIPQANINFGASVGYAYDSIAGPLKVQFHWSTITKLPGIYLSFGYNF